MRKVNAQLFIGTKPVGTGMLWS